MFPAILLPLRRACRLGDNRLRGLGLGNRHAGRRGRNHATMISGVVRSCAFCTPAGLPGASLPSAAEAARSKLAGWRSEERRRYFACIAPSNEPEENDSAKVKNTIALSVFCAVHKYTKDLK
jgi:hypothetical protein